MLMLVDCSNCCTPLQLPPGATSIRCALCQAITRVADPRSGPPPQHYHPTTFSSFSNGYNNYYYYPPPPSPYNHAPSGPPPMSQGRKKAVIVGISYKYSGHELKGCIPDAQCMKLLLINKFKFPESSILMLTDEETDPLRIPTKHNIRMAMCWLVRGCQSGDSLLFHYSGHGSQERNYTGDEIDGFDEILCPLDCETQGMIVDNEINETIVRPLPPGVKLHAIIDACHSGTVLDLPYLCRMKRRGRYSWKDHRPRNGTWKGTSGGEAILFSGCDDDQKSADTSALSKGTLNGAMTSAFMQAIENEHGTTYGSILTAMRSAIRETGDGLGGGGGFLTTFLTMGARSKQEPQLSANEPFDIYAKPFSL